ncbi:MAG: PHP domain-containing protein [Thermincola sp.]|nr:PHP domain-containing protein [Thermincola sp.]MDT3703251.1 PHP domain-containing protein [Thermincola sp.]
MNSGLIDLHVHTTASDGTMSPVEVVAYAAAKGLQAIAVTDHDTIAGVEAAVGAGRELGLEVVPGVEVSVDYHGEMHILGYFFDARNSGLQDGLAKLRQYRDERNPRMIEKLRELGFDITLEEVMEEAQGSVVGRPHVAAVMLKKGYVTSFDQAFDWYLGTGKAAYVKKERLTPKEGIELIRAAGGIPVLAHPKYLKTDAGNLNSLIIELKDYGLQGIEVFYTSHTPEETRFFHELALINGLMVTGGTDFHGQNKPDIEIGTGEGSLAVEYSILEQLKGVSSE